ncbi:MAG TPA: hemin uptake protein HemP [Thiobacillaceae bacterium]|nr:hemin uptake protein HemP [Thiobacillaceae bacterium]HNU64169.1 hemin uptake protein HemP [Thiobacillaceae bacterium]
MNTANSAKTKAPPESLDNGAGARARHAVIRADPGRATPYNRKVIHSRSLFESGRELVIRHGGADYFLRITSQNRLILTK